VRAGLASFPVAFFGGWIATQYVDTHLFSLVVPGLIGLAATWLAGLASYRAGAAAAVVVVIGAVAGLLGTALGFRLYPHGPHDPLRPWSLVGAPYLCAVAGAALWPVVLRPPRRDRGS
jgi:MFS family permease